jgi:dipeptidyl aminopeptidase/acylaminoacyl peptidase
MRSILSAILAALVAISPNAFGAPPLRTPGPLEIGDYFRINRVTQLALSSDGKALAYVVRTGSLLSYYSDKLSAAEKQKANRVYLRSLSKNATPVLVGSLSDALRLKWIPGTRELAFLSGRSGQVQVHSYDTVTGVTRQLTHCADAVEKFSFAPNGRTLAYMSRSRPDSAASLYDQFRDAERGIVVDPDSTSMHDFVNPSWGSDARPAPASLWVMRAGDEPAKVPLPGEPGGYNGSFFWSSDSRLLSVTYVSREMARSLLGKIRTSMGVFELDTQRFQLLAEAASPVDGRPGIWFEGGEWIPGRHALLIRRITETDPWVSKSFPDWTVMEVSKELPLEASVWHPVQTYGDTIFLPVKSSSILVEKTTAGVHSLYELRNEGIERAKLVDGVKGSSSLFGLSADFDTAAFVNESLTQPPEIYCRRGNRPAERLTHLNDEIADRIGYTAREVTWKSTDGAIAKGWLLEPRGSSKEKPWPMITHTHGGPGFAYTDSFAPYFEIWPYPFEVLAAQGIAIFIPNYRGTQTYGRATASPRNIAGEPMGDIVSGIKTLIASGVADPARLGITGHSHGAWLGPLTMARERIFRASSFAEGTANAVVMYETMSGDLNRHVHDATFGVSLYDSPERYIETSPDLYFKGLSTASLFEGGAWSQAIDMLGMAKAARRFGAPNELIVYPQSGHNLALPAIQRDSAQRNLDWFAFWLNGYENPDPVKAEQYKRWHAMRDQQKASVAAAVRAKGRS